MEMPQQEEWKFVSVVSGVWCVMITGISMMLKSPAENLDYQVHVGKKNTEVNTSSISIM